MRMRKDGEITIPPAIREQLGLGEGSELEAAVEGDCIRLWRADLSIDKTSPGWQLVERLMAAGKGRMALSTEETMRLTRGDD